MSKFIRINEKALINVDMISAFLPAEPGVCEDGRVFMTGDGEEAFFRVTSPHWGATPAERSANIEVFLLSQ